jgi:DNA-binding XRE family transcriptional regulator
LSLIERGLKVARSIASAQLIPERNVKKPDPRIVFGRRIAALRKDRGWSQEQLALESGLARSYLGGVERGQRNISLLNIYRLAECMSLPPAALFQAE